jgi:HTH-type transcriptional regulator/antitoxin HigA
MNALTHNCAEQIIDHFSHVAKYLKVPSNEVENQKLIKFARELKTLTKHKYTREVSVLLNLIYANIDFYEKHAYPVEHSSSEELLAFLMEQHDLTQNDLPEIGSQPHVSKILSGERNLTKDQIAVLSERFGVSPAVFFK